MKTSTLTRIAPFVVFMAFIAMEEVLLVLIEHGIFQFEATHLAWLYIPKAATVALLLLLFRSHYNEISWQDLHDHGKTILSVGSGVLVFILWINMDWTLGVQNPPKGFNPQVFSSELLKWFMIIVRVTGAVVIVPVMEELFWRSFLLRYLISSDFTAVKIGRYSFFSFAAVVVLFGLEHHYFFAGVMAGIVFNCIYYATRSICHCILSHAVANLGLAIYVLSTNTWNFW